MDWNALIALGGLLVAGGALWVNYRTVKLASEERIAGHRQALFQSQLAAVEQSMDAMFRLVVAVGDAADAGDPGRAIPAQREFLMVTAGFGATLPPAAIDAMKPVVDLASAIVYGRSVPGSGVAQPADALVVAAGKAVQDVRSALGINELSAAWGDLVQQLAPRSP